MEAEGFTVPQAVEVIRQVGEGLHALHQRGVLHRDMKPANVLFRTVDPEHSGTAVRAMVGDLGLGKALDVSSRLTMIAGTPSYVAPEQAQGEHLDARADQFSLAALAFLMLSGRAPYAHGSLAAAANPSPPPPLSTSERPLPQTTEDVVRRGLAADRDERWPDVPAFVTALRESLGDAGVGTLPERWLPLDADLTQPGNKPSLAASADDLPEPVAPKRPRRWPAAVLALVLLVVGGLAGFAWWRGSHDTEQFVDDDGILSVTVPSSWAREVSRSGWVPPGSTFSESALSVGDREDWQTSGQGVFVGLLPEDRLPSTLPHHPDCTTTGEPEQGAPGADPSLTATSTGCPGGSVIVERAVQVNAGTLLWVQVRSDDEQTAQDVLGSVRARGGL
jgi:serine/threonine protein kinase